MRPEFIESIERTAKTHNAKALLSYVKVLERALENMVYASKYKSDEHCCRDAKSWIEEAEAELKGESES